MLINIMLTNITLESLSKQENMTDHLESKHSSCIGKSISFWKGILEFIHWKLELRWTSIKFSVQYDSEKLVRQSGINLLCVVQFIKD